MIVCTLVLVIVGGECSEGGETAGSGGFTYRRRGGMRNATLKERSQ